jgi:hypothetical protein
MITRDHENIDAVPEHFISHSIPLQEADSNNNS